MLEADVEVDRREFRLSAAIGVAAGERLALFGPSGAGKTTILEAIAGLVQPRRGTVVLNGRVLTRTAAPRRQVPPWQRRVGLLRQDPALFPHLSVRQNLAYAPAPGTGREEIARIAERLGLPHANGLSMLVHQGAKALELWSGVPAGQTAPIMQVAARAALKLN